MAFTFFFRDQHTLEHVVNHFLPYVSGRSRITVWDAGCAMGPEPYTLAIMLAERMNRFSFRNLRIDATDIDETDTFGKIIDEGIYRDEEIKRIPADILAKYFKPASTAGLFKIDDLVRERLKFRKHNLLSLQSPGNGYSLIVCKNVLLHFQHSERVAVIKMFYDSLAPEGFLVMEQTQKMPDEHSGKFEQVVCDAQLYRKIG